MGNRWTWVAWSMLAIFVVCVILAALLAVATGISQQDAANQVVLSLAFSAFMVVEASVRPREGRAVGS